MTSSHALLHDLIPIIDFLERERKWVQRHLLLSRRERDERLAELARVDEQIDLVLERHSMNSSISSPYKTEDF